MAREDLNMGSSNAAAFISSLRTGLSSVRQEMNLLKQDTGGWSNVLGTALGRFNGRGNYGQPGSNLIAPVPVFNVTTLGETSQEYMYRQSGHNTVFNAPGIEPYRPLPAYYTGGPTGNGGGGGGMSPAMQRGLMGGAVGGVAGLPTAKEAVEYELATQRMVFYQQQASYQPGGRIRPFSNLIPGNPDPNSDYARATALLQQLGRQGTTTGKFDTVQAMEAARQLGIGGPNFSNVALGAAQMSNLTPGIGVEGSMRAYGAIQQGRNVNMLRGIGIRIRGEDGSMKPMPQIIDEIWAKLMREKMGNEPVTAQDVAISLQPGNALASMLDQYFGNDPLLRKQVEDGLMLKARSGGQAFAGRDLKKLGEKYGATTPAVSSLSQRITESTRTLQQAAPAMSDAFTYANRVLSYFTGFMNVIDRFTGLFSGLSAVKSGMGTLGNSGLGSILSGAFNFAAGPLLGGLLGGMFKAEGGPVGGKMPYVVGEQGPELFVPEQPGIIVPNHELKNHPFRHAGGPAYPGHPHNGEFTGPKGSGAQQLSPDELKKVLERAGFEGQGLANALKIAGAESGRRPYAFNPHGGDLSYGLFQINMLGDLMNERLNKSWKAADGKSFKLGSVNDLFDPETNARVAYHMSQKGYNWSSWSTKSVLGDNNAAGEGGADRSTSASALAKGGDDTKFSWSKLFTQDGTSNKNLVSDLLKGFTSMSSPALKTTSQVGATTYNYGGVTVNLSGGGSAQDNIAALKAALSNSETLDKAAKN
jgi:hypothetical protein